MDNDAWQVFICYRQVDGRTTAEWLRQALHSRQLLGVEQHDGGEPPILDVYLDVAAPALSDWRELHQPVLERSRALLVVCTPGLFARLGKNDWVHRELGWWLENRDTAPIVIDPTGEGDRWVPPEITKRWPNSQRVPVQLDSWKNLPPDERSSREDLATQQLVTGIEVSEVRVRFEDVERNRAMLRKLKRRLALAGAAFLLALGFAGVSILEARHSDRLRAESDHNLARGLISGAEGALYAADRFGARALASRAASLSASQEIRERFLTIHHWASGSPSRATPHLRRALEIEYDQLIDRGLPTPGEGFVESASARTLMGAWVRLTRETGDHAYSEVLQWKGLASDLVGSFRAAALAADSRLRANIVTGEATVANLLYSAPQQDQDNKAWTEEYEVSVNQLANVYRKAAESLDMAESWGQSIPVTWDDLQGELDRGEVLVDFALYNNQYAAWVLKVDGAPVRVELGSAVELEEAIDCFRVSLGGEGTRAGVVVVRRPPNPCRTREDEYDLFQTRFWEPLSAELSDDYTTLFIVPDGAVATVPFSAIRDPTTGHYLIDDHRVVYLTSAQRLIRPPRIRTGEGVLLVGGVDYYNADDGTTVGSIRSASGSSDARLPLTDLPGTAREIALIREMIELSAGWGPVEYYSRSNASEAVVRSGSAGKRIVHLATHGWAAHGLSGLMSGVDEDARDQYADAEAYLVSANPQLRSAVALAGASVGARDGLHDGILTALEVSGLDLRGIELAVLSSCQTVASGRSGDSFLGFVGAFQAAGVGTVLATLDVVMDDSAVEFMTAFYQGLLQESLSHADALREAVLALKAQPEFGSPHHWAPFAIFQ